MVEAITRYQKEATTMFWRRKKAKTVGELEKKEKLGNILTNPGKRNRNTRSDKKIENFIGDWLKSKKK